MKTLQFDKEIPIESVGQLFQYLELHFNDQNHVDNMQHFLSFLHKSLLALQKKTPSDFFDHLENNLEKIVEKYKDNEKSLLSIIQIIFQILNSFRVLSEDMEIKEFTFNVVISQLSNILFTMRNKKLLSNTIATVKLYMQMFPNKTNDILQPLWDKLLQSQLHSSSTTEKSIAIEILIHLFDEFNSINADIDENKKLIEIIQELLVAQQKEERKRGYFLLKKLYLNLRQNFENIKIHKSEAETDNTWLLYITIMENLEEEQSHLILPSLQNLGEILKYQKLDETWLNLLYLRILNHNNILVLRWAMEFFTQNFTCETLDRKVLQTFLETSNSNLFYNFEGYFLQANSFRLFLQCDFLEIYNLLPEINWKSIPLYIWLKYLCEKPSSKSLSFQQILNICSRVRNLQNFTIRQSTIKILQTIFANQIREMSAKEYGLYLELFCNSNDNLENEKRDYIERMWLELDQNNNNQRCEILIKKYFPKFYELHLFEDLQLSELHWFSLQLYSNYKQAANNDFIMELLTMQSSPAVILKSLEMNLSIDFMQKKNFKNAQIIASSLYINSKSDLNNINNEIIEFLFQSQLSSKLLIRLAQCLRATQAQLDDLIVEELHSSLDAVKRTDDKNAIISSILFYLNSTQQYELLNKYVVNLCEKYSVHCLLKCDFEENLTLLKILQQNELFSVDVKKGELRIEESFCNYELNIKSNSSQIISLWLRNIRQNCDIEYLYKLLEYHKEISRRKARYFANSTEHRLKLRIALGVAVGIISNNLYDSQLFDEIWNILINENNQLNITYIYEFLLGRYDRRKEIFLKYLNEAIILTSSQQVSIISAIFQYCMSHKTETNLIDCVVSKLLPLTMGANFHTRLNAQLVLYQLLSSIDSGQLTPSHSLILESIKYACGNKLMDHLNDIRFHICHEEITSNQWSSESILPTALSVILYVTHTPFDELPESDNITKTIKTEKLQSQIFECHQIYSKKVASNQENVTIESQNAVLNCQLQRKMNPKNDVTELNDLIVCPVEQKSEEMYVVASLIDKLPNLGGIARTCEVLGIKNLVLDTKASIEKDDFKNLSMTAEKSLNIIEVKTNKLYEFLLSKQQEGFKIVGAEQTSNSENFNNFKFPKKSILMLGHEKDGIPASLLNLLDYAVEIPQFGVVRSLNVHVTGALFMWEFCRQHLLSE